MVACGQIYPAVDAGVNKTSSFLHRLRCQKLTHLRTRFCFEACFGWFKERCCKIFTGGEWGLFPVSPAFAWPLHLPLHPHTERKIFRLHPIRWNWTVIQIFGQSFNSFSPSNDGTSWWKRAIARGTCGFVTIGQFPNIAQRFDNFCQLLDKNVEL